MNELAKAIEPLVSGIDLVEVNGDAGGKIPPFEIGESTLAGLVNRIHWLTNGKFEAKSATKNIGDAAKTVLLLSMQQPPWQPENHYLPRIDFKGGTARRLAETIENFSMGWDNIHVTPAAAGVKIPAFQVDRITFGQLPGVLSSLTDDRLVITWSGTFLKIDARGSTPLAESTETAVLPVQSILENYTLDDIEALATTATAMRTKREMEKQARGEPGKPDRVSMPLMSLHRETATLIVVGNKEGVDIVRQVVATLQQQPLVRETPPAPTP